MRKWTLDRRTMLRGMVGAAAVAVGLPTLEAMLDRTGTALADGSPIPKKFGMWFFGNGVIQDQWNPTTSGTGWALTPALSPLSAVKEYVSVVTNTWVPAICDVMHWHQWTALRRGTDTPKNGGGPNADDLIVDHLANGAKHRSIDVRISRAVNANYTADEFDSNPLSGAYVDPHALYEKLFSDFTPTAEPPHPGLKIANKSVLDAVRADATDLMKRLGSQDKARLEAHMQGISDLEKRLLLDQPLGCQLPVDPGPRPPDEPGLKEPLEEVNRAMSDLVAYALACDLTRSFRIHFTMLQNETVFWQVGAPEGHHKIGHQMADTPGYAQIIEDSIPFIVEQLAYLLGRLRETSVGDGNLLDHSCIWVTSEITAPDRHDSWSTPTLVVGKAGGALRGGVHYDAGGNPDGNKKTEVPNAIHARIPVTLMRALGMEADGFGSGSARATTSIAELMT